MRAKPGYWLLRSILDNVVPYGDPRLKWTVYLFILYPKWQQSPVTALFYKPPTIVFHIVLGSGSSFYASLWRNLTRRQGERIARTDWNLWYKYCLRLEFWACEESPYPTPGESCGEISTLTMWVLKIPSSPTFSGERGEGGGGWKLPTGWELLVYEYSGWTRKPSVSMINHEGTY